jgi:RNA polymerase sigma factor (sigma-70 family)
MANAPHGTILRHLRRLVDPPWLPQATDAQLLEAFRARRDETAFAVLVRRHGPMVLGVGRRLLRREQDAEDVYQATFLLLARQAGAVRNGEAIGAWLHRVAWRLATRTRARAASRSAHERQAGALRGNKATIQAAWSELQETLDQALHQLPGKYRAALVLCYLEGKSHEEAARVLACPVSTVGSWVSRGRRLLRDRLVRRGVTLSAAALATSLAAAPAVARVPTALARLTVQAARRLARGEPAAGVVSGSVNQLLREGLPLLAFNKLRLASALVLAASLLALSAGLWAHGTGADQPSDEAPQRADRSQRTAHAKLRKGSASAATSEQMTVTGQVVNAGGQAAAGAQVAVIGRDISPHRVYERDSLTVVLGQGRADTRGRFLLRVPRTSKRRFWQVYVLAVAPGHGLNKVDFDADARQPEVKVPLGRERIIRGRLVDLQGTPARNVQVQVLSVLGNWTRDRMFVEFKDSPRGLVTWPRPVTTDARGRFELRGLPAGMTVTLRAGDDRFARQSLVIRPQDHEADFSLAPAFLLEGTVKVGDTGQPVPRARLWVMPANQHPYDLQWRDWIEARADAQGHFRFGAPTGNYFYVMAYPAEGTPYLLVSKLIKRPRGNVKQQLNFALPRGVLVRGQVIEHASGQPVVGAAVVFVPHGDNNPFYRDDTRPVLQERGQNALSGPRGEFAIPVLPGRGHLVISGPTPDFVRTEITYQQLHGLSVSPGGRLYPDGVVALNLKPQPGPHEVVARLRRGVTLKGQIVGTVGKPVARAVLVSRAYLPTGMTISGKTADIIKDGRFQLHGCDPERTVEVFILDPSNRQGAVAKLSGKEAGRTVVVKLRPCGKATVRLVDKKGRPVPHLQVHVELIVTPGCHVTDDPPKRKREPEADACYMANLDPDGHAEHRLTSDAQGRVTLPTLIPGATFRLTGHRADRRLFNFDKHFTVNAGRTLDLGDAEVPPDR